MPIYCGPRYAPLRRLFYCSFRFHSILSAYSSANFVCTLVAFVTCHSAHNDVIDSILFWYVVHVLSAIQDARRYAQEYSVLWSTPK
jgi:hypothetical protein